MNLNIVAAVQIVDVWDRQLIQCFVINARKRFLGGRMMDAKTAIETLGNKCGDCVILATYEATEISALINRQSNKINQQEKYAELGRITDELLIEWVNSGMKPMEFIGLLRAKRIELLVKS